MKNLYKYILSTFNYKIDCDAAQFSENGSLRLLTKKSYNVYITPLTFPNLKHNEEKYIALAKKALSEWSKAIDFKIKFNIIDTLKNTDIKIYWKKGKVNYSGLQYSEQANNSLNIFAINIGVQQANGNEFTSNEIYHLLMHELGHVFGLGHSPNPDDVMCARGNWNTSLTENDLFVLKLVYSIGEKVPYKDCKHYVDTQVSNYLSSNNSTKKTISKDLLESLDNIGKLKRYNFFHQNIKLELPRITSKSVRYTPE